MYLLDIFSELSWKYLIIDKNWRERSEKNPISSCSDWYIMNIWNVESSIAVLTSGYFSYSSIKKFVFYILYKSPVCLLLNNLIHYMKNWILYLNKNEQLEFWTYVVVLTGFFLNKLFWRHLIVDKNRRDRSEKNPTSSCSYWYIDYEYL